MIERLCVCSGPWVQVKALENALEDLKRESERWKEVGGIGRGSERLQRG
jgi:hypothetical protein